jgi:HPt (histidine-containing phosphotransfer) domain-containing protein
MFKRLFKTLFTVGIISAVLVALGIGVSLWCNTRNEMATTMTRMLEVAAVDRIWETGGGDPAAFKDYLHMLGEKGGYQRLCAYTKDNGLWASWAANTANDECPPLIHSSGTERDWRSIHIAEPVKRDDVYLGVLYADGVFPGPHHIFKNAGFAFLILFFVVAFACAMATKLATQHMKTILKLVQTRLEQIKHFTQPVVPLALGKLTSEADALDKELTNLKKYLAHSAVPRAQADAIRDWHHKIISELVSSLRQNIKSDSPIVHELEDYALMLQTEKEIDLPLPQNFSLPQVFEDAVAAARAIHPLKSNVYLTASLHTVLRKEWSGQGHLLAILLRHLLLIALRRTRSGLVCLRLEAGKTRRSYIGQTSVTIILEDSGPSIQVWQLQQWLHPFQNDAPPVETSYDISWVLVGRLFHLLTLPVRPEDIESACASLAPSSHSFYLSYDIELHSELPPRIAERLPELKKELARQLMELEPKIITLAQQPMPIHILHEVHALKSVALTLGYFRVAALMAEIESAITNHDFADIAENWIIIRDCLNCSGFNTLDIPTIEGRHTDYCLPL